MRYLRKAFYYFFIMYITILRGRFLLDVYNKIELLLEKTTESILIKKACYI